MPSSRKRQQHHSQSDIEKVTFNSTQLALQREEEAILAELELLIAQEEYEVAEKDFYSFFKTAWSKFDPAPFVDNWHVGCIAEHLQAAQARQIRKLLITQPPRTSKSSVTSIAFPAWVWLQNPSEKFITASYSEPLATQFAVQSRQLMMHPWYKNRWIGEKKKFTMRWDSNTKTRIDNDKHGYRIVTSPGGIGTGIGYSICIIDDALNARKANSRTEKENIKTWYRGTLKNRANDANTDVMIINAQRLAEDDLPGFVLEEERDLWFHLNIPMEFERKYTFFSPINVNDPRKENEVLDPKRFSEDFIEEQKLDPYKYATLYQQRPAPPEGGIIKRDWLSFYDPSLIKDFEYVFLSADLSMTDSESSDFTVITVWGRTGNSLYLIDMIRAKMDILSQLSSIRSLLNKYPDCRAKLIEHKANGPAIVKMLEKEFSGIVPIEPRDFGGSAGDKQARLGACVPEFTSRSIHFPLPAQRPWVHTVVEELTTFPKSKHDDIVDSISQAINWSSLNHKILHLPMDTSHINKEHQQRYSSASEAGLDTTRGSISNIFNNSESSIGGVNITLTSPKSIRNIFDF